MLRSFRLGNHRSFRDEHELSLIPAYDRDRASLPVIAIYGANASGKSNLLDGLSFMRRAVHDSFRRWDVDEGVPRKPFRIDRAARSQPSTFVVELTLEGVRQTYGFTVDDTEVTEEWLYSYPVQKKRVLFERHGSDIKLGSTMADPKSRLQVIEDLIRPNALFLSLAAQLNIDPLLPAYRWFSRNIRFRKFRRRATTEFLARWLWQNRAEWEKLQTLVAAADIGITELRILTTAQDREEPERRLILCHGAAKFGVEDESDGTVAWLDLLVDSIEILRDGNVLVVDEIDASLHPLLTARLVDLFRNDESNPHGAQLIFSTHDASLLGTMLGEEVLARDQVWFVEKDKDGASSLYPLTDFKPRQGENAERRYLGGSYGAVPVLDRNDFLEAMRGR